MQVFQNLLILNLLEQKLNYSQNYLAFIVVDIVSVKFF